MISHQDLMNLKMRYGSRFLKFPSSPSQLVPHHLQDHHHPLQLSKNMVQKQKERIMSIYSILAKATIITEVHRVKLVFLR
uniref:Uncharacterized protein n=1 Tax=Arundo donax TaxID=35708 RepID=A0A0A9E825_ARUDO